MKRLRKSTDRVFSGVCAGITEYFNPDWDPVLVRTGFVVLTVFNPLMIVVYLGLAIVMPSPEIA